MTTTHKVLVSFIAGLIVGGGVMEFISLKANSNGLSNTAWLGGVTDDLSVSGNDAVEVKKEATGASLNTVTVLDQKAGMNVAVKNLSLSGSTWVAIHEDTEGEPGKVLGARLLASGTYADQVVELLRGTVASGLYYVALYADDGDRQFDMKKDAAVKDASGKAVLASFKGE